MEINGIAHVMLTVGDYEACYPFYSKLLPALGMRLIFDQDGYLYYVGGRTAVGIVRAEEPHRGARFVQTRVGLHHVCFRARQRADVDTVYALVQELGATIVHAPEEGPWAPGYYSLLFEDPDGIRLEINHVPGKGWLADPPQT